MSKAKSGENNPLFGITGSDHHLFGKFHSFETRKKMSEAQSGEKNYMFSKIGPIHPRFGKTHSQDTKNKMSQAKVSLIYLYSLDLQLLGTYSSLRKIAKYLECTHPTIMKYIRSRKIFKNQYILSLEELSSLSKEIQKN